MTAAPPPSSSSPPPALPLRKRLARWWGRAPAPLRFVARRLALAVPTLFGVAVVTFALIHLAPGDPGDAAAAGGTPLSRRAVEAQRRIFFLDLPLFFNPSPRGLGARERRVVDALLSTRSDERRRGLAAARACDTLCLDALAKAAKQRRAGDAGRAALLGAIDAVRAARSQLGPSAPAQPSDAERERWLAAVLPKLALERVAAAVTRAGESPERWRALRRLGRAALPAAMAVLLDSDAPRARRVRASGLAAHLAGFGGRLGDGDSDANVLAAWRAWWYRERREHVRYGASARFFGHVTETQFGRWIGRLLTLQLGTSLRDGRAVTTKLAETLPVTMMLGLIAMAIAYLVGVPLGVWAARRAGRPLERGVGALLFLMFSLPSFWVAMMAILLFGGVGYLDWFPIYGLSSAAAERAGGLTALLDRIHHMVLPVFCLSYAAIAVITRHQRGAMLAVLREDYMRTARAKGLSERAAVWRHGVPNALLPTITLFGLHFPFIVGGSVIVERIFNIRGMGLLAFEAFQSRDYPVVMAVTLLAALVTLAGLLLSDLLYGVIDPRIAAGGAGGSALGVVEGAAGGGGGAGAGVDAASGQGGQ